MVCRTNEGFSEHIWIDKNNKNWLEVFSYHPLVLSPIWKGLGSEDSTLLVRPSHKNHINEPHRWPLLGFADLNWKPGSIFQLWAAKLSCLSNPYDIAQERFLHLRLDEQTFSKFDDMSSACYIHPPTWKRHPRFAFVKNDYSPAAGFFANWLLLVLMRNPLLHLPLLEVFVLAYSGNVTSQKISEHQAQESNMMQKAWCASFKKKAMMKRSKTKEKTQSNRSSRRINFFFLAHRIPRM